MSFWAALAFWTIAGAGWLVAAFYRGVLGVSRRRVANARAELATALSDADYNLELTAHLLERLGNAESEVMRLSGQLRA